MNRLRRLCVVLALAGAFVSVPAAASAALLGTYKPNPADMEDLDHHNLYTWRISDPGHLSGQNITKVTLTFSKLYNWDTSSNILYLWLFNDAYTAGTVVNPIQGNNGKVKNVNGGTTPCATVGGVNNCVMEFADDLSSNPKQVNDFGLTTGSSTKPGWLVDMSNPQDKHFLTSRSFAGPGQAWNKGPAPSSDPTGWTHSGSQSTGYSYTYTFSTADLAKLQAYLADGVFALGLDPDCHYYNDGITLQIWGDPLSPVQTAAVPEPASLLLLGTGLALLVRRRLTARKR